MAVLDEFCKLFESHLSGTESTTAFDNEFWFFLLSYASVLSNVFFFVVIWQIKEMHVHPLKLFMWISVFDATLLQMDYSSLKVCESYQIDLLTRTMYFSSSLQDKAKAIRILYHNCNFLFQFSYYMTFYLNSALCLDLIITLSSPFKSAEKRTDIYVGVSTVLSLLCLGILSSETVHNRIPWLYISNVLLPIVAFVALAIVSTTYAMYKLCRPGISDEVRGIVLRRHILNVVFEFSINLYFILSLF